MTGPLWLFPCELENSTSTGSFRASKKLSRVRSVLRDACHAGIDCVAEPHMEEPWQCLHGSSPRAWS